MDFQSTHDLEVGIIAPRLGAAILPTFGSGVGIKPGFPIFGVFRLNGQSKRDGSIIVRSCKASQSPVYPIRDAILAVNHASCPSSSSSGPRLWGESALKTSRLPGALSLLAKSWLYPPSAWRLTCLGLQQPPPIPVEHRCLKATPHKVHVQELAEPTPLCLKQASTPRTPMIRLVVDVGWTRTL